MDLDVKDRSLEDAEAEVAALEARLATAKAKLSAQRGEHPDTERSELVERYKSDLTPASGIYTRRMLQ